MKEKKKAKVNKVCYETRWIVGLTGQSGAGKTLVSKVFEEYHFGVINCDEIARKVTAPRHECVFEILFDFPECVDEETVTLNRAALAKIIFSDKEKRDELNRLIFRYIRREVNAQIAALKLHHKFVLLDAPTLFESGFHKKCDYIVSVTADEDKRLKRVMERDGIDEESARLRFSAQHTAEFFESHSNYVIRNNTTIEDVQAQAFEVVMDLYRLKR